MANQATAKKGEEFRFDTDDETTEEKVIFKRIGQQREEALGKNQGAYSINKAEQEILTGKDRDIVNILEYKAKINSVAQKLTPDPQKQEAVKKVVNDMVSGESLLTENESADLVSKAIVGANEEKTPAIEMATKEAVMEIDKWEEQHPEEANQNKREKYINDSLKQARLENKDLTLDEERALEEKFNNIAELLYPPGSSTENQRRKIAETFRDHPGKAQNSWHEVKITLGLVKSKDKPSAIFKNDDEINVRLGKVKVPSNYGTEAFGRLKSAVRKNSSYSKRLDSIQGGGGFLVRLKMTFYRLGHGWGGGGIVQPEGEFARVGNQSMSSFAPGAVGFLMQNGLDSGLGGVLKGMVGSGVKSTLGNLAGDAALKLAGGALGPAGVAAAKVLGFLKNFFGNAGSKLGIGVKNGLGSAFDKTGSGLGKLAMGLGALLASVGFIGTAAASTMVSGAVVGGVAGVVVYQQNIVPGGTASGFVTAKKVCESSMEYIDTEKKPEIPCSDMSQYTEEMRNQILQAGYQTRCAVVAAAQYMIYDFPYHVPYKLGGYGEADMGIDDDWCNGAMDCIGFVRWSYRQGGFAIDKQTSTAYWEGMSLDVTENGKTVIDGSLFKTNTLNFVPNNCGEIKERVQAGDIVRHNRYAIDGSMHAAMVIGVDDTRLQIVQEGGNGRGLNTCFIDICKGTGRGVENGCGVFDRISLMDTFFDYYAGGGAINGYAIKPDSDKIQEFPERDKK